MAFGRYSLTFIFALAPAAVSAQSQMQLRSGSDNQPYATTAYGKAHDDEHSLLERAHQQWHFEHDRGQRDRTYQREHELLHQRLTQTHDQWHTRYDPRDAQVQRERAAKEKDGDKHNH